MSTTESSPHANTASSPRKPRKSSVWEIYYPYEIDGHRDVVHVASFPEIIFFWPTIVVCFLSAFLQGTGIFSPVAAGWMLTIVLVFNFIVLVQDFDQKQFFILVLVTLALLLGIWIVSLYGFSFFKSIANWLASFQPSLSTDAYLLVGSFLLILFSWGVVSAVFDYWRIEQNEFVHFAQPIGRDMSIARLGCTVYKEYPDIFETILTLGGGTLVIKRDNQVLATIRNVPFLGRRMNAIEHMLSETRVTISNESTTSA